MKLFNQTYPLKNSKAQFVKCSPCLFCLWVSPENDLCLSGVLSTDKDYLQLVDTQQHGTPVKCFWKNLAGVHISYVFKKQISGKIRMRELTDQDIENLSANNLAKIFKLTKKKEVVKQATGLTITGNDLLNAIIFSEKLGYSYFKKTHFWAPDNLSPTDEEIMALGNTVTSQDSTDFQEKFFRKINQGFKERKMLIFHLFVAEPEWHVVYFNEKDSDVIDNNHWKHGPHIHFVNYLWGIDIESLCDNFPQIPGNGVHIKYEDS